MSREHRAVIIGGGISGLAAAAIMAQRGWSVDLLEARRSFGGRAGTWEEEGFRFDTGPSWYLMPEVFEHFFEVLGTSVEAQLDLQRLDPGYRVFFEGHDQPLDVSADVRVNIERFESIEPGAGQALERYLDSARSAYELALARFLYTSFDSLGPFADRRVLGSAHRLLPLLLESLERFAARRFQDTRLRQVLGYPAVFLGSSPDRAPALYHLMSAMDLTGGVLYPQGGFGELIAAVERLARDAGARLHAGVSATEILTVPRARRGRRAHAAGVRVRDAEGRAQELSADVVISSADLHLTETTMLPRRLQTYPESWWRRRTPGPGAVLVMLGVDGPLERMPHHSLFFTRDWQANFSAIAEGRVPDPASVYVCRPSATDRSTAPQGQENLFVLAPVPADPQLGRGGLGGRGDPRIEAIADAAIDQVARWSGHQDLAQRIVLRRTVGPTDFAEDLGAWRGSMLGPAHILTQSAMFRAGNRSRRVDGLYYTGSSSIPGIGLPMCLISAEVTAQRVQKDLPQWD